MTNRELMELLRAGIAAARAGEKERARRLLLQVIERDEGVEAAWLWLSDVVDDPAERQICLENVLTLNPANEAARAGLRWLQEQKSETPHPAPAIPVEPPLAPPPTPAALSGEPPRQEPALVPPIEIDPYGCPYCAGPLSPEEARCLDCGRPVTRRYRKRGGDSWLGWLVICFLLLGATSVLEGLLDSSLMHMEQLPPFFGQTAARFFFGSALVLPGGAPGELVEFADAVAIVNYVLAGLCTAAAVGLALKSRVAYFGSFLLGGFLVVATGSGLLTGLAGWIPSLLRLGLIIFSLKWLADSAPAFEWQTQTYTADLDGDLRTDMDYYNRGQQYREMGMWAKAAVHWKVAAQLAPARPEYRGHLARAYLYMGYPEAALAEVDRALAYAPADEELLTFRASLLQTGGKA